MIFELDIDTTDENLVAFSQEHELDGIVYTLRFLWNTREEAWVMNVYQPDGTPLALGRKVVLNFDLLRGEVDTRLPAGNLYTIDTTGQNEEPGRIDIGVRVPLIYADAEELSS